MKVAKFVRFAVFIAITNLSYTAFAQEVVEFRYDALGRLIEASTSSGPNSGLNTRTGFDPAGNRSVYTVTGAPQSGSARYIFVPLRGMKPIPVR
jgi:YD repeat-containing protein